MRKNIIFSVVFIIFILSACKTTQKPSGSAHNLTPVFTIDGVPTYQDEFFYAYDKSNKNKGEIEPVEDYLDLYINFKLKVAAARAEGIDTLTVYQEELAGYLKEIQKPYLVTEQTNLQLVEEAYLRLQQEINASHILIRLEDSPSPSDTLQAYQKIQQIKERLEAGEGFSKLARELSEDPSAKNNEGNLGWFTAFQMVYPFESAAYQTNKNEISNVVRTRFGYHLIKVNDKRETLGRIKIAHLMKRFPINASEQDSLAIELEIKEHYKTLRAGGNWFALVAQYSDDLNTMDQGGSLPWFGAGNLPSEMETAAFELSEKGDLSKPVKSPYGWHILKLEDKRGVGSFESMQESLSRRVERDQRSELKASEVISKLKRENNYKRIEESYALIKSKNTYKPEVYKQKELDLTLFQIGEQRFLISDFLRQNLPEMKLENDLSVYEEKKLLEYEEENLENKYPDYKMLRNEYRDGLLLFEIMSQKVWNRINEDSTALRTFYESNQSNYKQEMTLEAAIFTFSDSTTVDRFKKPIRSAYYPLTNEIEWEKESFATVLANIEINDRDTVFIQLKLPNNIDSADSMMLFDQIKAVQANMHALDPIYSDENKIYLQLLSKPNELLAANYDTIKGAVQGIYPAQQALNGVKFANKAQKYVVGLNNEGDIQLNYTFQVFPEQAMNFEEAKPELLGDYQEYLEEEWLKSLKMVHQVLINDKIVNQIKEKVETSSH